MFEWKRSPWTIFGFGRTRGALLRQALLIAVPALLALYFVAANVLLGTPMLRGLLGQHPAKLIVEYSSAWSLWPGRVWVRNVRVRVRTPEFDMYIALDRALLDVDLLALIHRRFRLDRVRGRGLAFWVRPRLSAATLAKADPQALAALPDIPGLPDPTERPPEDSGSSQEPWVVDLENVDVEDARDIRIGAYRFAGRAEVHGGFYLQPGREVRIRPSTASFHGGAVTIARRYAADELLGDVFCVTDAWDPRRVHKRALLRYFSFRSVLWTRHPDLLFLNRWLGDQSPVEASGGAGSTLGVIQVDHGRLLPGSSFRFELEDFTLRHPTLVTESDVAGALSIDSESVMIGTAAVTSAELRRRYAEAYPIRVPNVGVMFRSAKLDLATDPFADTLLSADLPRAEVTDLRMLEPVVRGRGKVHIAGGHAVLQGHADFSLPAELIRLRGQADSIATVVVDDVIVHGRLAATAPRGSWSLATKALHVPEVRLEARDVHVDLEGQRGTSPSGPDAWWTDVQVADMELDLAPSFRLGGRVSATMKDAAPILHVYATEKGWPRWVEDLLQVRGVRSSARVAVGPGLVEVREGQAVGGPFRLIAWFEKHEDHRSGQLHIGAGPLGLGVELHDKESSVGPELGGTSAAPARPEGSGPSN